MQNKDHVPDVNIRDSHSSKGGRKVGRDISMRVLELILGVVGGHWCIASSSMT